METDLRLRDVRHQEIAEAALAEWLPSAKILYAPMPPGRSGVELVRVDISGDTAERIPGSYVLRVGPAADNLAEPNERAAHLLIRRRDPEFADRHIPRLLEIHKQEGLVASLHEVAGNSLARFAPPGRDSTSLLRIAQHLSRAVMDAWSDPRTVDLLTPYEALTRVVGDTKAEQCRAVSVDLFGSKEMFEVDGRVFADPALVLDPRGDDTVPFMAGLAHGDLHIGNLLVERSEIEGSGDDNFWIVDVDQARESSVAGIDLAYLEVSVLVNFYPGIALPVLSSCLNAAEERSTKVVPDGHQWLVDFLRAGRGGLAEWIEGQPGRSDQLRQQMMLVRIIAALQWAKRFPGTDAARTCLAYAGWYSLQYRRRSRAKEPKRAAQASVPSAQTESLWQQTWHAMSQFSPRAARYVLVAEQLPRSADLAAIGQLPWSVIIDLDPSSDSDGLYAAASPLLDAQRSVHLFTTDRPQVAYDRGTAWMLAGGSVRRREGPVEFRTWVHRKLDTIRQLISSFRSATGELPITVLLLEGGTQDVANSNRDRLLRVVDVIDEVTQGGAAFVHLGLAELRSSVPITNVPLPVPTFLGQLAATVSTTPQQRSHSLPAMDGLVVEVSTETMQTLQEHMTVLHGEIEQSETRGNDEAFWRGGLITWADLDAGVDVPRSVHEPLVTALRKSLESHRTRTVLLEHQPGAGGTTAALRAAWDLHLEHPVAVLRMGVTIDAARVTLVADRLQRIFVLTQRPVLLVAEGGDLSEPYRELLYRELNSRNARATILYVRRMVGPSGNANALSVSEPLDDVESEWFHRRYADLATDPQRLTELGLLRTPGYAIYRTPFFYGLITFEREFNKLQGYVRTHLGQVRGRAREVLQYLALTTIFSNSGLQIELVQKLMRVSTPTAELTTADLVGVEAARLVTVRAGRLRLLHQLLAEQVLVELLNDTRWEQHLKDLSIGFVEALARSTDPSSEPVRVLLRQMFVDRQGSTSEDVEDRGKFAPLIDRLDRINNSLGHQVLRSLTEAVPDEPHFWNHLGRHQMYIIDRDLDLAENYLSRAVDLAPEDALHHHTLGLVRRGRMRHELRRARKYGLSAVMAVMDDWFARTVDCFTTARQLSPDSIYGYITHVQAIVDVAKSLKGVQGVRSVAELDSDASEWITENLTIANELLDTAAQLYGTLEQPDIYMTRCQSDISRLYDDLDSVVELWEVAVAGTRSSPALRRALAQAYYVRGRRSWRELDVAELRRIVELARHNLTQNTRKEEDYRLWFEAYKLLPEFDFDEVLAKLQGWSDRFPSWRSHYYQYCLQFYLWFDGRMDDRERFLVEQQKAHTNMLGRTRRSHLWLASSPEWCPLVADTDLGGWNRRTGFWSNTEPLQRVNGIIDYIDGPQAGRIELAPNVAAFFVPIIGGFQRDSNENDEVNFFLGLSPEGLRAWDVQPGHVADGRHAREGDRHVGRMRLVPRQARSVPAEVLSERANELYQDRLVSFAAALLEARASVGDTPLSFLVERVQARFRDEDGDVASVIRAAGRFSLTHDEDPIVYLRAGAGRGDVRSIVLRQQEGPQVGRILSASDQSRSGIIDVAGELRVPFVYDHVVNDDLYGPPKRGQVVRFVLTLGPRGADGREVELLPYTTSYVAGEVIDAVDLPGRLESDLRMELERQLADDRDSIPVAELRDWAESRFIGAAPLAQRLGLRSIDELWDRYAWLQRTRHGQQARLRTAVAFGRVPSEATPGPAKKKAAPAQRPAARNAELDAVLAEVVPELKGAGGKWPSLKKVQAAVARKLGDRFETVVGGNFQHRLNQMPNWRVEDWRVRPSTEPARSAPTATFDAALRAAYQAAVDRDQAPTLQILGTALRTALGQDGYVAAVGSSLKTRIERMPEWSLTEVRPGVHVLSRADGLGALLEQVVAEMREKGKTLHLPAVGNALRAALVSRGAETKLPKPLRHLVVDYGWVVDEPQPDTHIMRRADEAPLGQ
ncbi:P-loop NTPase [Micromonospora chersina]